MVSPNLTYLEFLSHYILTGVQNMVVCIEKQLYFKTIILGMLGQKLCCNWIKKTTKCTCNGFCLLLTKLG